MLKKLFALAFCLTALHISAAQASVNIGDDAPNFKSLNTYSKPIALDQMKGKIVVLEWTNHECPFVVKHYESGNMQKTQKAVAGDDVVWISIVSSAPNKQGYVDAQKANAITLDNKASPTHKILDPTGEIGRMYGAKTTPHMFVINKVGKVAYQGAIDNHSTWRQRGLEDATNYVVAAVESLRAGKTPETAETAPYGCGVKY